MWATKDGSSIGLLPGRKSLGPLFLIAVCPIFAVLLVCTNTTLKGDAMGLVHKLLEDPVKAIRNSWHFNQESVWALAAFAAFELLLMRALPGRTHYGPVTATGHRPVYNANGPQAFFITVAVFLYGASQGWWKATIVADNYLQMVCFLCVFSIFFCLFLTFKGLYFPSSEDSGSNGDFIMDFYWGTELYPRIFGWDVKMFTNCRFGMMGWAIGVISFAAKNAELNGDMTHTMMVSLVVQLVYLAKFFWWEHGYLNSIDIMHDRAGYYICWGCLVWVPSVYMGHTAYYVHNQLGENDISCWLGVLLAAVGVAAVFLNYEADRQRMFARQTEGRAVIFGQPVRMIEAFYETKDGKVHRSLLLASHLWGTARHFHYVFELTAALVWCVPVQVEHFTPYFYFVFLVFLLFDRAWRDDQRCSEKYGAYWDEYRRIAPYKVIPYII